MDLLRGELTEQASPAEALRRVFGFPAFRSLQEAAVARVMAGGDALVLMPTGGGKSVCYQVPALCLPGTTIVISPLIALMDDQVAALRQLGVAAGALHSELEPDEQRRIGRALDDGALDLVYVSPERLLSSGTLERLRRQRISLIAIDEAHCVSQWGHEFRPEYRALACLPEHFPGVPRIALTATADPRTRDDILASLGMREAEVFTASFHRRNLHVAAEPKIGETAQLQALLKRHPGSAGIVYCGSRAKTERVAASLAAKGIEAIPYHAKLDPQTKRDALARFRSGEAVVVVATIAFGMGIDRPDVRFVVHLDMPDSPEGYYQQIGRAGRDGEPASTLLLYGGEDIARARHFLQISAAPEAQKKVMRQRLESMIALCETAECRTRTLLACFGETLAEGCGHCDTCAAPPSLFDGTVDAQKVLSAVYRTGQRFGVDIFYTLLSRIGVMPLVTFVLFYEMQVWLSGTLTDAGYVPPTLEGLFPFLMGRQLLTFCLYVLILDCADYWRHRLSHRFGWWYALHAVHHAQRQMTFWSDDRNHVLDDIAAFVWFFAIGLLIGIPPMQFPLVILLLRTLESISHANARVSFGWLGERLLVSPRFHRAHHGILAAGQKSANYGAIFPVWDITFGTADFSPADVQTGDPSADDSMASGSWAAQQAAGMRRLLSPAARQTRKRKLTA